MVAFFAHFAHFGGRQSHFKPVELLVGAPRWPSEVLNILRYPNHNYKIASVPKIRFVQFLRHASESVTLPEVLYRIITRNKELYDAFFSLLSEKRSNSIYHKYVSIVFQRAFSSRNRDHPIFLLQSSRIITLAHR